MRYQTAEGRLYYYCPAEQDTRWEPASGPHIRIVDDSLARPAVESAKLDILERPTGPQFDVVDAATGPPGADELVAPTGNWIMYRTPDGRPYYHQLETHKTVWGPPSMMERASGCTNSA